MEITYYIFTDKGNRDINEDSVGVIEEGKRKSMILCDGLGGHGHGEVASALVVDSFKKTFKDESDDYLEKAFTTAQEELLAEQVKQHAESEMKTTAVCLYIDDMKLMWGHVGDSRLYAFKKNKVVTRTIDHSVPQMLVLTKEIKEKEIRNHPDRNRLLKVMGTEWSRPAFDLGKWQVTKPMQSFLLCSDGFWELIEEKEMCRLLKESNSAEEWVEAMAKVVRKNGEGKNMDNFSAIAVWIR